MNFARLPDTRKQWELTFLRGFTFAGLIALLTQVSVRVFLAGLRRQDIEEIIAPYLFIIWLLLLVCALRAFHYRERLLGIMAALIGILSGLITLLPVFLSEGVYD